MVITGVHMTLDQLCNLETRHSHMHKGLPLLYKILNDKSAPHLRAFILKLNNYTNINYYLRNLETDLLFQGQ